MADKRIILAGLPGEMATLNKNLIKLTEGLGLAELPNEIALTGEEIKGRPINDKFIKMYSMMEGIDLIKPKDHEEVLKELRERYPHNFLYGINFATKEGWNVNHLFVKNNIPFISGVTGVSAEEKSKLVKAVKLSKISAIIDKNMSSALVVLGAMLNYAAQRFPGALKGYTGYGIEEHQEDKKDPISGTLLEWKDALEKIGVSFYAADGSRWGKYGHADHFMRVSSPDGDVKLNWMTEVLGRDTYARGTIEKGLPFLIQAIKKECVGEVYSMEDALANCNT